MNPRKIHGKAEVSREKGDFVSSLQLLDEAIISYQEKCDYFGIADALTSQFLTLKHLYYRSGDDIYLIWAEHTIKAAVKIAEEKCDESGRATPYYSLAQYYDEVQKDYPKAISYYQKAINIMEKNPPEEHKSHLPAYVYTMQGHLYACEYLNGDKTAAGKLRESTKKIVDHTHPYERDVWMSGGYMKLALILHKDDPSQSSNDLMEAKRIIDSNPDLIIRGQQWNKLAEQLS